MRSNVGMKAIKPKQIPTAIVKSGVSKPAKPVKKVRLSKKDPDYYKKIGQISAAKRKMTSEDFSEMARKSHPRKTYSGGRKKKDAGNEAA